MPTGAALHTIRAAGRINKNFEEFAWLCLAVVLRRFLDLCVELLALLDLRGFLGLQSLNLSSLRWVAHVKNVHFHFLPFPFQVVKAAPTVGAGGVLLLVALIPVASEALEVVGQRSCLNVFFPPFENGNDLFGFTPLLRVITGVFKQNLAVHFD